MRFGEVELGLVRIAEVGYVENYCKMCQAKMTGHYLL